MRLRVNMKFEVKNIVISVVLFMTGFLSGNALNFPITEVCSISNLISLLGIFVTALIGISALHTWKHQFKYIENCKVAIKLGFAATKYIRNFHDYRYAYLKAAQKGTKQEEMCKLAEFKKQSLSHIEYVWTWKLFKPFIPQKIDSMDTCEPYKLKNKMRELLKPLHHFFTESKYVSEKDRFDELIESITDTVISEIHSCINADNK